MKKQIIHKESNIKTNQDLIELPDKDNFKSVAFPHDRSNQTKEKKHREKKQEIRRQDTNFICVPCILREVFARYLLGFYPWWRW